MRSILLIFFTWFISSSSWGIITPPWHSNYKGRDFDLEGKRALIITTSHDSLDTLSEDGEIIKEGEATGVYASEMTEPYYEFLDSGMSVDLASIKGGKIPIDPQSLKFFIRTSYDSRYLKDEAFKGKVSNSLSISEIDVLSYDVIFIAGGWGAAYDLAYSEELGNLVTQAYANRIILAAVCHGPLGLVKGQKPDGSLIVDSLNMTAVTDKQVTELGIEQTPMHPEKVLRALGAKYESRTAKKDIFANHVVVDDIIITGQNQKAGIEVAQKAMELLER